MRPIEPGNADVVLDIREHQVRVLSCSADALVLESTVRTPKGPFVTKIALTLGQLLLLQAQVRKDFNL